VARRNAQALVGEDDVLADLAPVALAVDDGEAVISLGLYEPLQRSIVAMYVRKRQDLP
jgi:hypothetical protein